MPWATLFLSVVLYIVVPVVAAQLWRRSLPLESLSERRGTTARKKKSGAALANAVGVLVEVPAMLSVVRIVLRTRGWYQGRVAVQ